MINNKKQPPSPTSPNKNTAKCHPSILYVIPILEKF
tara:strand:- start:245 stop:352 length:108 start_codon:yes stop_codon:yes gene_type:complete